MEEVRELKNVLEKVEGKIIAAEKIYAALNFGVWLVVMSVFFVLLRAVELGRAGTALYWGAAMGVGIYASARLWKRVATIRGTPGGGKKTGAGIALSWVMGSIVGWFVIPSVSTIGVSEDARFGVGFLVFIGLSLLGEWLVIGRKSREYEMIPSFLLPLLGIPAAWNIEKAAILWAGFLVAASYSITITLYLYSAFKAIER